MGTPPLQITMNDEWNENVNDGVVDDVDDVLVAYDGDGDLVIPPLGLPRPRPSPPD